MIYTAPAVTADKPHFEVAPIRPVNMLARAGIVPTRAITTKTGTTSSSAQNDH